MSDFGFYSADELFKKEFRSREPLIEKILYEKDSVLLAGKPKTGKSVLLFQIICALTSGEPFLDRFEVRRKCRVLYIQLEGSLSDSQDRFKRMMKTLALDNENLFLLFSPPKPLNHPEEIAQLIYDIKLKMTTVDVVIIDPVYFAMQGSLSDDEAVRNFTGSMRILQEALDCACILVHHFKKSRRDKDGMILAPDDDDIFGSVFFQAWITHQFLFDMDKSSKARTLQCNVQRSGGIIDKLSLGLIEPNPLYFQELGHWPTKPETIIRFYAENPNQFFTAKETYLKLNMARSSFYKAMKTILVQNVLKTSAKNGDRTYGFFDDPNPEGI